MKFFKYLALLAATTMFLAACQQSEDEGGTSATTGTLTVLVQDADTGASVSGDIAVTQNATAVDTATGVSSKSWDVEPGQYEVAVSNAAGYNDLDAMSVTVTAGETTTYTARLQSADTLTGNVASVDLAFTDEQGVAYDVNTEENYAKDALLIAAQNEEPVQVTVTALDEAGDPVANAPVTVNVTNGNVALYAGKASNAALMNNDLETLITDADGEAFFVIQGLGNYSLLKSRMSTAVQQSPVTKILVSARGADDVANTAEFKAWFYNISHLWYSPNSPSDATIASGSNAVFNGGEAQYATTRVGAVLDDVINIWDPAGENVHNFSTWLTDKQPTSDPSTASTDSNGDFYVAYEIVEASMDGETQLVEWVSSSDATTCDAATDSLTGTCTDTSGGADGVALTPIADVELADLPIEATVKATMYVEIDYGADEPYVFALKDYTFTKYWVGSYLSIDKEVDHHVLTWAGPEHTLAPYNDDSIESGSVFTANYTVTVTNEGADTAVADENLYDVVVTDDLPAELGVIVDTDLEVTSTSGLIGTYSPNNHSITWSYANNTALEVLEAGEQLVVEFEVYARQKPGYSRDDDTNGLVPWTVATSTTDYQDPYLVTNGFVSDTVVVSAKLEDDVTANTLQAQYRPEEDESDIWVVRPIFDITKEYVGANTISVDDPAEFTITMGIADVADHAPETANPSTTYADLAGLYPTEFGASEGDRDNPYANGVEVLDGYQGGQGQLDYNDATSFSATGQSDVAVESYDDETAFRIDWSAFDAFGRTVEWTANVTPIAQGSGVWANCAYLQATNFNQTENVAVPSDSDFYGAFNFTSATDTVSFTNFYVSRADVSNSDTNPDTIWDCATVTVTSPGDADLTLSIREDDEGGSSFPSNEQSIASGSDYWYKAQSLNQGSSAATSVEFTITISPTTAFDDAPASVSVFVQEAGQSTPQDITGNSTVTSDNTNTFTVTIPSLAAGAEATIAVPADANSSTGEVTAELNVSYGVFSGGTDTKGPATDDTPLAQ